MSQMSGFQVTPEYLSQAATSCTNTAGDIAEQLTALQTFIIGMEDYYKGIAANTFQALMEQYNAYATELNQALNGIANGLHGNWANYTDNEQTNVTNVTNVQSGLPAAKLS